MLFCPNCGAKNEDGAKFCERCGAKLEEIANDSKEWNGSLRGEKKVMPYSGNISVSNVQHSEQQVEQQDNPTGGVVRPSQARKERQAAQENTSFTVKLKKPNIDVEKYKGNLKKITKMQKIVFAEVAALILVIVLFGVIGTRRTSAEAVAKQWAEASAKGDWDTAYDLVDYPDGKFLSKSQYIETMERADGALGITDIKVTSDATLSSEFQKTCYIQYNVKGEGTYTNTVDVIKQGTKSLLFFDDWKISSTSLLEKDYGIYVPKGAGVTVDGIALTEADLVDSTGEGLDLYEITLFRGVHTLQVALPWFGVSEETFITSYDEYTYSSSIVDDFAITDSGEKAIQVKAQEALEKIYQAAAENKNFSEVQELFLDVDAYRMQGKNSFEYLKEELNGSRSCSFNNITYSDFGYGISVNEEGAIDVKMSYNYDLNYTYIYKSWSDDSETKEIKSSKGTAYMYARFACDGETYKLVSVDIPSIL